MLKYYETWAETAEGRERLSWIEDPDFLISAENNIEGVYAFEVVECDTGHAFSMYVGQIGFNANAKKHIAQTVHQRALQHSKRWLGSANYKFVQYWTGIHPRELRSQKFKLRLRLLCEEADPIRRLELETLYIGEHRPYLQCSNGKYKKYPSLNYKRADLCIVPWKGTRATAFCERLNEA